MSFRELNHEGMECWSTTEAVLAQFPLLRTCVEEDTNDNLRMKRYLLVDGNIVHYLGFNTVCGASPSGKTISSQLLSKLLDISAINARPRRRPQAHAVTSTAPCMRRRLSAPSQKVEQIV